MTNRMVTNRILAAWTVMLFTETRNPSDSVCLVRGSQLGPLPFERSLYREKMSRLLFEFQERHLSNIIYLRAVLIRTCVRFL